MELMAEWNSLWPIASTFSAPLLIPDKDLKANIGPLLFTPNPTSSTTILHSPSLSPHLPPPYPQLKLSKFLRDHTSVSSSATSISSFIGPLLPNYSSQYHAFNSLQLLYVPNKKLVIAFFPVGDNSHSVGFSSLSIKDGVLGAPSKINNSFRVNGNCNRITCLLVNPLDDFSCDDRGDVNYKANTAIGLLMVCTEYTVYWYRVGITAIDKKNQDVVCLDCVGSSNARMLMGKSVASACWSPHLDEECLVLLESGGLLLFDVADGSVKKKAHIPSRSKVESHTDDGQWFGCDFSWHPRIFIVGHRNEILLIDLRSAQKPNICCLLKIEMLSLGENDGFFSLSKTGSDGFYFIVATKYMLLLCDVRKPLIPVLRWRHTVRNPRYATVFRLSELRANAEDTKYNLASESGYCVILGSFWDNDFSLFCYGPNDNGNRSVHSEISKFCNSYYAWGFPSEFSLSGSNCTCGSCLVREEFWVSSLPVWIDWRRNKEMLLGFGILKPDLSAQLSSFGSFGGFTLIRLTSSGKLEAQNYLATWGSDTVLQECREMKKRKNMESDEILLYNENYSEIEVTKGGIVIVKLEFLNAYLKDELAKLIVKRRKNINDRDGNAQTKYAGKSKFDFHQESCLRLKDFGYSGMESSSSSSTLVKDITWPTSIHEIALSSAWAALPRNLLELAFTTYADFYKEEPLEFLDVPNEHLILPFPSRKPSHRSNKWSTKVQPSDAIVGAILPTHFLTTLHLLCVDELKEERELYPEESEAFSAHSQFKLLCDKAVEVVREHTSDSDAKVEDDFVSLADDTEDMSHQIPKLNLSCHNPSAFLESPLRMDILKPGCENHAFLTHVFRRRDQELDCDCEKMVGKELFDVGCPIELDFDDRIINLGPTELELFRTLKKQDLESQKYFKPYQDYIAKDGAVTDGVRFHGILDYLLG